MMVLYLLSCLQAIFMAVVFGGMYYQGEINDGFNRYGMVVGWQAFTWHRIDSCVQFLQGSF